QSTTQRAQPGYEAKTLFCPVVSVVSAPCPRLHERITLLGRAQPHDPRVVTFFAPYPVFPGNSRRTHFSWGHVRRQRIDQSCREAVRCRAHRGGRVGRKRTQASDGAEALGTRELELVYRSASGRRTARSRATRIASIAHVETPFLTCTASRGHRPRLGSDHSREAIHHPSMSDRHLAERLNDEGSALHDARDLAGAERAYRAAAAAAPTWSAPCSTLGLPYTYEGR